LRQRQEIQQLAAKLLKPSRMKKFQAGEKIFAAIFCTFDVSGATGRF